jgi:hypothetical protein
VTRRTGLVLLLTLAALMAGGVFFHQRYGEAPDPFALEIDGIGPLRLGTDYEVAKIAARHMAPGAVLAGVGCGGRDEISYSGTFAGLPVTVMAMADDGVITHVEMTLDDIRRAGNEAECLEQREQLRVHFMERFEAEVESWVVRKPVSSEHMVRIGPAVVVARWFATGGSCYISAVYGADQRAGY